MSVPALSLSFYDITQAMGEIAPHRPRALFEEFLPRGYAATALDSIPERLRDDLLRAKVALGTLITLYDDLADRPESANPQLLVILYQLSFERRRSSHAGLGPKDRYAAGFAEHLFDLIHRVLSRLQHYGRFKALLDFDLAQFYAANQYSALVRQDPHLHSRLENALYTHHNMGMVLAGFFDLVSVASLEWEELGRIREVFLLGQRMGRIFNVLTTYQRERGENDFTNEIPRGIQGADLERMKAQYREEVLVLGGRISRIGEGLRSFSVPQYLKGLKQLQKLHGDMEGIL